MRHYEYFVRTPNSDTDDLGMYLIEIFIQLWAELVDNIRQLIGKRNSLRFQLI